MDVERDWVRIGRAPLLFAAECATAAWLGLVLVALYLLERDDARVPVRRPEALVALAVGLVALAAGVAGVIRSRRMGLRIDGAGEPGACLVSRELLRTRSTPLIEVVDAGLVRSGVGATLYCRTGGNGFLVHAVSSAALSTSGSAPAAALAQELAVRARVARGDRVPELADPLPDLPPAAWTTAPVLPAGLRPGMRRRADPVARRRLRLAGARSAVNGVLVVVFALALATTSPRSYTAGIAAVTGLWLVLQALARLAPTALRFGRPTLAVGPGELALRVGAGWRIFELDELAGVGRDPAVTLIGWLRRPVVEPALVLVAGDGRRLGLPGPFLDDDLRLILREAVAATGAVLTGPAAVMLAAGGLSA